MAVGALRKVRRSKGAPAWVLTYADLMSLLLCFFILLAAMSQLKIDDYRAVVREIQRAFGVVGGSGPGGSGAGINRGGEPAGQLIEVLRELATQASNKGKVGAAVDAGPAGKHDLVRVVRRGEQFVMGSRITFEAGSTDLTVGAREDLKVIAKLIRGYNNVVELRGHASAMERGAGEGQRDLEDLSYARARAVRDFMVGPEMGLNERVFRIVACGANEPLVKRVYDQEQQTPNRRVEVVVDGSLVSDWTQVESQD